MIEGIPFYNPALARDANTPNAAAQHQAAELLRNPEVGEMAHNGEITLAMIRPNVGPDANLLHLPDIEAAEAIEERITELGMMAKFSFTFSEEGVREFYGGGPQASMEQERPIDPTTYPSRWPEFIKFMSSGPTTAFLLYTPETNPDKQAIPTWRAQLGYWNISERREAGTIRGDLGVNKYNNLVHGSDKPEAIIRELGIIARCLTGEL